MIQFQVTAKVLYIAAMLLEALVVRWRGGGIELIIGFQLRFKRKMLKKIQQTNKNPVTFMYGFIQ